MNNSSQMDLSFVTDIATNPVPVFCFPEVIAKMPMSLTYCFLYMMGCVFIIGCGFYHYFSRIVKQRQTNINDDGYVDNQQNFMGERGDSKILRGMFRRGQNSKMQQIPIINGGEPRTV